MPLEAKAGRLLKAAGLSELHNGFQASLVYGVSPSMLLINMDGVLAYQVRGLAAQE